MASSSGPARPRAIGWNGAGGCVIVSQVRQVNFSRTVWITFHCRGITSSVSVTVSPSSDSLPWQHGHSVGPGITTRSRGRCAGNGPRTGLARVARPATSPAGSGRLASASAVVASSSSSCSSNWSSKRRLRSEVGPKLKSATSTG